MGLNPYLNFNGQCEEAFKYYEKVLGGKIIFMMTWGEDLLSSRSQRKPAN